MVHVERSAFGSSFELWREDGVLHLVLAKGACLDTQGMKELLRLAAVLDPEAHASVLVECGEQVIVPDDARMLMQRSCTGAQRAVAFVTTDLEMRLQGELFKRLQRPRFPFKVFGWREDAWRWVRERKQLRDLKLARSC
ncbi:MAG: hypothetical protein WEC15_01815 [Flavobacteriales bacterium]